MVLYCHCCSLRQTEACALQIGRMVRGGAGPQASPGGLCQLTVKINFGAKLWSSLSDPCCIPPGSETPSHDPKWYQCDLRSVYKVHSTQDLRAVMATLSDLRNFQEQGFSAKHGCHLK